MNNPSSVPLIGQKPSGAFGRGERGAEPGLFICFGSFEGARLHRMLKESVEAFSVEAPCFSRGELDFSPAEKRSRLKWALAAGFSEASAKAHDQSRSFSPA